MATIRWAICVVAAGLLVGCADAPKPQSQAAIARGTSISVEDARAQFKTANPLSSVGVVKSAIRADQGLIAAGDFPEGGLAVGDVVSIVAADTAYPLVANGVVQSLNGPYAIINFTDARRAPENGDLVIHLPPTPHVTEQGAHPGASAGAASGETPPATPATAPAPEATPPTPAPAPTTPPAPADTPAPAPATAPAAAPPAAADAPAPAPSTTETPKPADAGPKPGDLNK